MKHLAFPFLLSLSTTLPAAAEDWAVGGYDVVAYSDRGHPIAGRRDIATMWHGKLWYFANEENRARFESDPRGYAPAFGGLCPVSLAEGRREAGDPDHFMVIGSRLYLMRSGVAERRIKTEPRSILSKAQKSWSGMR
ncbi:YHS domain-containing (seleno)protein [Paracoccus sp. Z330]|uniref:YHS domain-containing (Seleno)protein n=1 Tax=Paracoccus onchidii TaxID=3017813 RepID=A0ABT4ZAR3_9RHOB|nr:YHS domain-containing (seleno)protein [Paracoccus onchidii]MDB6176448.1 YHS domain-containing (seleno)protein [Paracoccus onchidii]